MNSRAIVRYNPVAIMLHWLIALLIIGMLAVGKYMTGLAEDDPLAFTLVQWHKTFGILILGLAAFRLAWRLTHTPPPDERDAPVWERLAASASHMLFYVLIFALPLTGWIMVSASPLNVDTLLFNVVPWPHLPPFPVLDNREAVATLFEHWHVWLGNGLLVLLLIHAAAALKHHYVDRDGVLMRMVPDWSARGFRRTLTTMTAIVAAGAAALIGYTSLAGSGGGESAILGAGASEVGFVASVSGADVNGRFGESSVDLQLDEADLTASSLTATVRTASFDTDNPQVNGSLGDADWFGVDSHPEAQFSSTAMRRNDAGDIVVEGELTLKGTTETVSFPLSIESTESGAREAQGEFVVDRIAYGIGSESQPGDGTVGHDVTIRFRFDLGESDTPS